MSSGFEWLEDEPEPVPKPIFPTRKRTGSVQSDGSKQSQNQQQSAGQSPRGEKEGEEGPLSPGNPIARVRTLSDTADYNDQTFLDLIKTTITASMMEVFVELFARLLPPLRMRLFYFSISLVILSLVIFGHGSNSLSLNGVPPSEWYSFLLQVMATDIAACIFDESVFLLIDRFWIGAEEFRLYAHCLNGPLGFILTVSVTNGALSQERVPTSIENWNPIMSAVITIWTLYTMRQFYERVSLNKLLVSRFSPRLNEMQLDTRVLSILAHCVPRRTSETLHSTSSDGKKNNDVNFHSPHPTTNRPFQNPPESPQNYSSKSLPHTSTIQPDFISEHVDDSQIDRMKALDTLKQSSFSKHFANFIHKQRDDTPPTQPTLSLSEIFSEIVESSHRNYESIEEDISQQSSFWARLSEVSSGYLVLDTANGKLIIRNKKHAVSFGNRLYTLLSRGGNKKVTAARVSELIQRHVKSDEDVKEIIQRALILFHLPNETDPDFQKTCVSINTVNEACISVFRSRRNIASSLSDFGELRKSLVAVMDVLFWISMVIVGQMIVKIDLESVFAPVLTLIFAVSFAVGPVVSNVFLAIGYVSFMLPYDVGDRIAIGLGPSRTIGNVSSITLLQTTITTIYNEKVKDK